jgi:hypothetical protein
MSEDSRGPHETYDMEYLLTLVRGSPVAGGRDWRENPTRFKLIEATYFLDNACEAYQTYKAASTDENRDILLFNLSAYFSAVRSITWYMQKQYKHNPGFDDWYSQKQEIMKGDIELVFQKKVRDEYIHIKLPMIASVRECTYSVTANVVCSDNNHLRGTEDRPVVDTTPSSSCDCQSSQIATIDVLFDGHYLEIE